LAEPVRKSGLKKHQPVPLTAEPAENYTNKLNLVKILRFPSHFFDQKIQSIRVIVVFIF